MDYQKGKIYKIESHVGDKIYIGSTSKQYLSQRMTTHRNGYGCWKKGNAGHVKAYDLFDEYGIENCTILLIEAFPCNSRDELHAREGHYIRTLTCVNKMIPGRTTKEWCEDNKVHVKQQKKAYAEKNEEKIKEYKKQPYRCECGCKFQLTSKAIHQTSIKHLEFIEKEKQFYKCECGCKLKFSSKSGHEKSNKHIEFTKNKP